MKPGVTKSSTDSDSADGGNGGGDDADNSTGPSGGFDRPDSPEHNIDQQEPIGESRIKWSDFERLNESESLEERIGRYIPERDPFERHGDRSALMPDTASNRPAPEGPSWMPGRPHPTPLIETHKDIALGMSGGFGVMVGLGTAMGLAPNFSAAASLKTGNISMGPGVHLINTGIGLAVSKLGKSIDLSYVDEIYSGPSTAFNCAPEMMVIVGAFSLTVQGRSTDDGVSSIQLSFGSAGGGVFGGYYCGFGVP